MLNGGNLVLKQPVTIDSDFTLYEAVDDTSPDIREHVYSCVVVCRKDWKKANWPALGGTRWHFSPQGQSREARVQTHREARELAMSMYIKNTLLRKAEMLLPNRQNHFFGWQGGKGVIWTPYLPDHSETKNKLNFLTPHRLMCHGRLIESIKGEYIGSKDMGIGTTELKWIKYATRYAIGLGCLEDTGKATAYGVLAGLEKAALEHLDAYHASEKSPIEGLKILVIGIGKVGLPLLGFLEGAGADIFVYDPGLLPLGGGIATEESVYKKYQNVVNLDAAVDDRHKSILQRLLERKRIFADEETALTHPEIQIISPNGGLTRWLSRPGKDGRTRAQTLAEAKAAGSELRLILGAGNDQVSTTDSGKDQRKEALDCLSEADILFIPDPLVSPGGVIAVSHELAKTWDPAAVLEDTKCVVQTSVREIFHQTRALGKVDSHTMYRAFEQMIAEEWLQQ